MPKVGKKIPVKIEDDGALYSKPPVSEKIKAMINKVTNMLNQPSDPKVVNVQRDKFSTTIFSRFAHWVQELISKLFGS